jgi:hypothetical protein
MGFSLGDIFDPIDAAIDEIGDAAGSAFSFTARLGDDVIGAVGDTIRSLENEFGVVLNGLGTFSNDVDQLGTDIITPNGSAILHDTSQLPVV